MKRRYQYPELEIEMMETNIICDGSTLTYDEENSGEYVDGEF